MSSLLITSLIGILFAIFAAQNDVEVDLVFNDYIVHEVPVFLVALFSLVGGLVLALFIHTAKEISQGLTVSGLNRDIKKLKEELAEAKEKVHELEVENAKLAPTDDSVSNEPVVEPIPDTI